jgi:hypothetical protein
MENRSLFYLCLQTIKGNWRLLSANVLIHAHLASSRQTLQLASRNWFIFCKSLPFVFRILSYAFGAVTVIDSWNKKKRTILQRQNATYNNFTVHVISSITHSLPQSALYTHPDSSWLSPPDGLLPGLLHPYYPLGAYCRLVGVVCLDQVWASHCAWAYLPSRGQSPVNWKVIEGYINIGTTNKNKNK